MPNRIGAVFYWSAGIILALVTVGVFFPDFLEGITEQAQTMISTIFGWYYLIIVTLFVIVCLFFIISPHGKIKLGKPDDTPEFTLPSWFALLFSAGMGTGLVFWGAAEPISHYAIDSPTAETGSDEAILESMRFVFFHWGLHAWGIYAIVAICLAYFKFRKEAPGTISSTLSPLFNMDGALGKVIDVVAVVATVTGIATTLGFGATQINGGISFLMGIGESFLFQLGIIAVITVLYLISTATGLQKGIRYLSNTNLTLAAVLLLFVIIVGPTLYALNIFTDTIGKYIQTLPEMSFRIAPTDADAREWIDDWTIFYWAWWMAWSPYVGTFIARVSKGRTLRQFTIGVLLVPSVAGFIWFSFLGGSSIFLEDQQGADISSLATEEMLFGLLSHFPFATVTSILSIVLIAIFFITSGDSATFVLGMQTTNGSTNPARRVKFIWGILLSAIASVLLYSGGLQAVENTMIVAAFPFSVVMLLMVYSLLKALREDKKKTKTRDSS
ncbi:glycine betaine transporter [Geomicrobium halophilum]|uniref:Glycine betaine transporter n=1 Tax=Geomicrobium halophilum TaxID=549000 RepID=A0A841PWL3_9BACL|nr:BCCT family transporter [Geomicrobium halophilum]MBB6448382.1 glycine betaine transporter [Geomicrobium halophilum]